MFSDTSTNIAYDVATGVLSANTQNSKKEVFISYLSLVDCLTINLRSSSIQPCIGPGNYMPLTVQDLEHTKREVTFKSAAKIEVKWSYEKNEGTRLSGDKWTGKWESGSASINLDDCVRNTEGCLEFVAP